MSNSIQNLIKDLNYTNLGCVRWNTKIDNQDEGIYIISLTKDINTNFALEECPISENIVRMWTEKVNGFIIDGEKSFDFETLKTRFSKYWLCDENIIYIGKANKRANSKGLGNRVSEFYRTEFGERKPHAGGHWIKLLENLNDLYVHHFNCKNPEIIEIKLLEKFQMNASEKTKLMFENDILLPFANLELGKSVRKKHNLKNMKNI